MTRKNGRFRVRWSRLQRRPRGCDRAVVTLPPRLDAPPAPGHTNLARRERIAPLIALSAAVVTVLVVYVATSDNSTRIGMPSALIGKPAPAVTSTTIEGQEFELERYRGQWVIINFFGTWCTPCIQEHPELIEFKARHRVTDDATVVTVAFADSPANVREFFERRGGEWPVLADDTRSIAVDFGVIMVPETFIVSPSGIVRARLMGATTADRLDDAIQRLRP